MRSPRSPATAQSGFMLLEVLVSILIFAIGVLSLVGVQATSVKQSSDAKYRADASLLADDLLGRMWVSNRDGATLKAAFETGGAAYAVWASAVEAELPGVTAATTTPGAGTAAKLPPSVTIETLAGATASSASTSLVTIVISWKPPGDLVTDPPHTLTVVTQINNP